MERPSKTDTLIGRITLLFMALSPFVLRSLLAVRIEPVFQEWPTLLLALVFLTATPLALLLAASLRSGGVGSRLWVEELVSREHYEIDAAEGDTWAKISERLNALGFECRSSGAPRRVVVFKSRDSGGSGLLRHGFVGFVSVRPLEQGVAVEVELRLVDLLLFVVNQDRQLDALAAFLCLRISDLTGVIGLPVALAPGLGLAFASTALGLIAEIAPSRIAPWISALSWAALGLLGWAMLGIFRRRLTRPGLRVAASGLYLASLPHLARVLRIYIGE